MYDLFDAYPGAESLALAGIAINWEPFRHQLSPFIYVVPREEDLDRVYLPRV